jgi:hypothetical protein
VPSARRTRKCASRWSAPRAWPKESARSS